MITPSIVVVLLLAILAFLAVHVAPDRNRTAAMLAVAVVAIVLLVLMYVR